MYKKLEITLLSGRSGNYKSRIYLDSKNKLKRFNPTNGGRMLHMYFTSRDEPVSGDSILKITQNMTYVKQASGIGDCKSDTHVSKKIEASTNRKIDVLGIPESFIDYFIERYNLGDILKHVFVEVEDGLEEGIMAINPFTERPDKIRGILEDKDCVFFENSNTPYSIKSVKRETCPVKKYPGDLVKTKLVPTLYTREEAADLIKKYYKEEVDPKNKMSNSRLLKWVEENV